MALRQFATSPCLVNISQFSHQAATASLCFFLHFPRSLAWWAFTILKFCLGATVRCWHFCAGFSVHIGLSHNPCTWLGLTWFSVRCRTRRSPLERQGVPLPHFRRKDDKVSPERDTKKKKISHNGNHPQSLIECAPPPLLPGPSGINFTPAENSSKDDSWEGC